MAGFHFFVIFMLHKIFVVNYEYLSCFLKIFLYKMAMTSHKISFFANKMSIKCTGCPIITEIDTFYHVTYPISDF